MSSYQPFTSSRTDEPDFVELVRQLRTIDTTIGVQHSPTATTFVLKKTTPWSVGDISTAQTILDTAPGVTPQRTGQNTIDTLPIFEKAIILALVDELNRLRTQPTTVFPAITPAQAITAIRNKAATL